MRLRPRFTTWCQLEATVRLVVLSAVLFLIVFFRTDWVPVLAFDAMREVVARISGRVFVGLPTCQSLHILS